MMYQQAASVMNWLEETWSDTPETSNTPTEIIAAEHTAEIAPTTEPEIANIETAPTESRTRVLSIDDLRQKLGIERPAPPPPRQSAEAAERPRIVWRRDAALAAC